MMKNQNIKEYTDKTKSVIDEMQKCGLSLQPYERKINNLVIERGIAITDSVEVSYIPTWKLAE